VSLDDPELLEREYASSERLERRRHNASAELLGPLEAPAAPNPFTVTRRNRVYVAEKAS
jgi:hypothetical protein